MIHLGHRRIVGGFRRIAQRNALRREVLSARILRAEDVCRSLIPAQEVQAAVAHDARKIDEGTVIEGGAQPYGFTPAASLAIDSPQMAARLRLSEKGMHQRLVGSGDRAVGIEDQE